MISPALVIDGKRLPAAATFPVIDPATGASFIDAPLASLADVDAAVAAARRAFPGWAATPIEDRARAVLAVADAIEASKDELAALLSREQGKPLVSAGGEIMGALGWARATAALRLPVDVIKDDDSVRIEVHRKPLGVVGSISPWNFPVMISIWHIIPALIAGNCVVMKPSSYTPLAALRMVEIANAHLPPGVLNSLTGEGDIGRAIAGHPGIDKIVFTGSTPTGRSIMVSGAANLKRLTLELGGNDAAIVMPDADIDKIAPKLFLKAFMNSGQICAAVKRIYVHESLHDALAEKLAEMARGASVGPATDPASQFGPVQNQMQFDHVRALAEDAKAKGGRFLTGGEPMGGGGYFFPLSIAVDVRDGMRIVDEEQFGPILPIIRYANVEDALMHANASENGLGGSIWSSDAAAATALAQRLECGTAWVNDHASISPDAPFGGAKQSGIGVEFGLYGLEEYTQIQTLRVAKV